MEYELACNRLCDDISQLLLDGPRPPTKWKAFAAGRATQDLAAAFHRAAGRPGDELVERAREPRTLPRSLRGFRGRKPGRDGRSSEFRRRKRRSIVSAS